MTGFIADGVAVVEDFCAGVLEFHHGLDLRRHGFASLLGEGFRVCLGLSVPVFDADFGRQVAQRIVRGGLVGDNIDGKFPCLMAAENLWEYFSGIADKAD